MMLSVIFLFMQDSPFFIIMLSSTLTASYVLHSLALRSRVPRPRLRVFGCIAPACATPAADSVQRLLYYKTSRAEKIDSAKIKERCCEYYGNGCCRVCGGWEMRSCRGTHWHSPRVTMQLIPKYKSQPTEPLILRRSFVLMTPSTNSQTQYQGFRASAVGCELFLTTIRK